MTLGELVTRAQTLAPPAVGLSRVAKIRRVVVFPAPLAPSSP